MVWRWLFSITFSLKFQSTLVLGIHTFIGTLPRPASAVLHPLKNIVQFLSIWNRKNVTCCTYSQCRNSLWRAESHCRRLQIQCDNIHHPCMASCNIDIHRRSKRIITTALNLTFFTCHRSIQMVQCTPDRAHYYRPRQCHKCISGQWHLYTGWDPPPPNTDNSHS